MYDIDEAVYRLTVTQRDAAWVENERLREQLAYYHYHPANLRCLQALKEIIRIIDHEPLGNGHKIRETAAAALGASHDA